MVAVINQMIAGIIIQPEDQSVRPSFEAVQWAEKGSDDAAPDFAWSTLGLKADSTQLKI